MTTGSTAWFLAGSASDGIDAPLRRWHVAKDRVRGLFSTRRRTVARRFALDSAVSMQRTIGHQSPA
ncbi:hypothetical protein DWG18_01090 [Lysobacter sp. TY2-98]|nr:hypothetical protein DWG18_01090 [Lysobacter sp. TY2-98]